LQTVAANIDRDVFEVALQQLTDLILLTDTTGLLTGEEDISVQGVTVAVQRETLRQRQLEFLQHTSNPMDAQIMGIKGRGAVLRSVSQTIGLEGDEVVPTDQELEQRDAQQKQQAQQGGGPIGQMVQKGVAEGVEQGVKRISTELTAGLLAQRMAMPEGGPTHIGTLPGQPGQSPLAAAAAQAQGAQASPMNQASGPAADVVSPPRAPPGPGGRPAAPVGGPG